MKNSISMKEKWQDPIWVEKMTLAEKKQDKGN
jgi:hypothetical protein